MEIERLDHLVLTVRDIPTTCQFYSKVLGMKVITFNGSRKALLFGQQKINLHQKGHEYEPKALVPTPGSADFCLLTKTPLTEVIEQLKAQHIPIEQGPLEKHGALGKLTSIYLRDPDQNLLEISNYQ